MAIIKCPECGGKISTSVDQCIHCGCKIRVCPECGMTHVGEVAACAECGHSFAEKSSMTADASVERSVPRETTTPTVTPATASVKNSQSMRTQAASSYQRSGSAIYFASTARETVAQWKKDTSPIFFHIVNVLGNVFSVSGLVFLCLAILISWCVILFNFGLTLTVLAAFLAILSFHLAFLSDVVLKAILSHGLAAWSRENDIDLLPILKKSFLENSDVVMTDKKQRRYYKNEFICTWIAYCGASVGVRPITLVIARIISLIMSFVACCFVGGFVLGNSYVIYTDMFAFDWYEMTVLLGVGVLLMIVRFLIVRVMYGNIPKKMDAWLKEKFSTQN